VLGVLTGEKSIFDLDDPKISPTDFFQSATLLDWIILAVACAAFFALDLVVLKILPNTLGWYVALVGFWVAVALAFNVLIWIRFGTEEATYWAMGYGIEWMLSLDNLMLIQMVFILLRTPPAHYSNTILIGVVCSIFVRLLFFLLIVWMVDHMEWVRYPCAAMLVWSGIQGAIVHDNGDVDLEDLVVVRVLRRLFGDCLAGSYSLDGSVFKRDASSGRFQATLLLVAILMIILIDTLFSLDCVAVKASLIPNGYIAFSSSLLAMFGLRAMFFIIASMMERFDLLRYGLCIILLFVALEIILAPWVYITPASTFLVMGAMFAVSVAGSAVRSHRDAPDKGAQDQNGQPQEGPTMASPSMRADPAGLTSDQ